MKLNICFKESLSCLEGQRIINELKEEKNKILFLLNYKIKRRLIQKIKRFYKKIGDNINGCP